MTKSDRLKPIQKIADKKERKAATAFGKTLKARNEVKKRLEDLQVYHKEYLDRFAVASQKGINVVQIQEYQSFIAKLELAIEEQKRALENSQHTCDDSKHEWQGTYSKSKAMETAVDRLQASEKKDKERIEQSISDDRSQRKRT